MEKLILESKKVNKKVLTVLIISIVLSVTGTSIFLGIWFRPINIIEIYEDNDFFWKYHFPGKGTEDDPYIIDGYHLSGNKYHNIYINSVTKHFIIQNCVLENSDNGIVLFNLADNIAKIINNTFRNCSWAIEAHSCSSCFISNNFFENNYVSIETTGCNGFKIQGNTFSNNIEQVIDLFNDNNVILLNNTITNISGIGFLITYSQLVLIEGNTFTDCEDTCIITHYITSTTIVNNSITNCNSGIEASNGNNVVILGNNLSIHNNGIAFNRITDGLLERNYCSNGSYYGIRAFDLAYSIIRNNVLQSNNSTGMYIAGGGELEIKNNAYYNNSIGLEITSSNKLTISHNIFEHNLEYGMYISAVNATIWSNNFIENNYKNNTAIHAQAKDMINNTYYKGYSLWYNNITKQGNYWSELAWFAGVEYIIDHGNRTDYYPLEARVDTKTD